MKAKFIQFLPFIIIVTLLALNLTGCVSGGFTLD